MQLYETGRAPKPQRAILREILDLRGHAKVPGSAERTTYRELGTGAQDGGRLRCDELRLDGADAMKYSRRGTGRAFFFFCTLP